MPYLHDFSHESILIMPYPHDISHESKSVMERQAKVGLLTSGSDMATTKTTMKASKDTSADNILKKKTKKTTTLYFL